MMAHAGVDPYWKAKVQFEVAQAPTRRAEIEDTCLRCHAPGQQFPLRNAGGRMKLQELDGVGRDGVSCTVCHQILPTGLGKSSSFTANFKIGTANLIFGPHADPFAMPMLHHTGFEPRESKHVLDSALCGSCHTVITSNRFLEQAPFLEWLASGYPESGQTCQSCHMPQLRDAQYIAHRPPGGPFPPTQPRLPFGMHEFIGGNAVIPELLARSDPEQAETLRTTAKRATQQLERALRLRVSTLRENGFLFVTVEAINFTGHKLPTGFPSRQLWLHLVLAGDRQTTLFESGAWDPASGELRAGAAPQPHYRLIEKPSQVQIFETEALTAQGQVTHALLNSASHAKDNRILPRAFDVRRLSAKSLEGLKIDPVGVEIDDAFRPGSAVTVYKIPLTSLPRRLTVEALYQSIKPAHRPASFTLPPDLSRPIVVARFETVL